MRFLLFLLLLTISTPAHAADDCYKLDFTTKITDPKEAELLLDQKLFNDQRDDWEVNGQHIFTDSKFLDNPEYWQNTMPGYALISNPGHHEPECMHSNFQIMAWTQINYLGLCNISAHSYFTQLSGNITAIRTFEFDVEGILSSTDGGGRDGIYQFHQHFHQEKGKFTFSRKNHPSYWSLSSKIFNSNIVDRFDNLNLYITKNSSDVFDKEKAIQKREELKEQCPPIP